LNLLIAQADSVQSHVSHPASEVLGLAEANAARAAEAQQQKIAQQERNEAGSPRDTQQIADRR
jgi:hypothetical protein